MKIFDIITEAKNPRIRGPFSDGTVEVTWPDGKTERFPNMDTANTAVDNRARNRIVPSRDTPDTKNAPTVEPGPRPGTPTEDQLTRSQRRKLSRHGRVKIRGITYTSQQIAQATELARRVSNTSLSADPDDRPNRPSDTDVGSDPKAAKKRGILKKIMDAWKATTRVGIGAFLNVLLTAVEVEETFDRMVRVWVDEVEKMQKAGQTVQMNDTMNAAYFTAVERIVELSIKGLAALPAAAVAGVLGYVIGTGPAGWIALIIGGGLIGYYGVEGLYQILDKSGVVDKIENWVATSLISKEEMLRLAVSVDVIQKGDPTGIISDDPFTIPGMGESRIFEEDDKEIAAKLQDIISSDPELLKMYKAGKEKLEKND
jgi:hypothetical protein